MMMMMINKCDQRIEFFCLFVYAIRSNCAFFLVEQKRSLYFSLKLLNLSERCIFYRTVSLAPSVNTMTFPWRECACQEMVTRWPVVRMIKASNFGTWVMLRMFPWIPAVKGRAQLLQRQPQMIFLLISNIHIYCGETSVIQTPKRWSQVPALQRCWYLRRRELYEDWYLWDLGNRLQWRGSGCKERFDGVALSQELMGFCESLFLFSLTGDVFVSSTLLTINLIDFLKRYWS